VVVVVVVVVVGGVYLYSLISGTAAIIYRDRDRYLARHTVCCVGSNYPQV